MRAVRFHEYGDVSVLSVDDLDDPEPSPDEVVIRVRAVGLNHVDIDMRNGTSRLPLSLPHTLGIELAGEVAALGGNVTGIAEGERVAPLYQLSCRICPACLGGQNQQCKHISLFGVHRPGGYAEYVTAPASSLILLSDKADLVTAAAVQTTFGTVWHAMIVRAALRAGETVLISAAGSGVGSAALELAKLAGARTIVTAGSDWKLQKAISRGADHVVNYSTTSVTEAVLDMTNGAGADVAVEHVGGEVFTQSLAALAPQGRLVVCGAHAGEVTPVDLIELFRNEWSVIGCARASESELRHVVEMAATGLFEPVIDSVFDLADAGSAHRKMEDRGQFGKIVLTP